MREVWTRRAFIGMALTLCLPVIALAQDAMGYRPESAVSGAAAVVRPSVVAVETRFEEPILSDDYIYWQFYRGSRPLYGLFGSGFIYSDTDYVITTTRLMDHAEYIRVILDDGRSYQAELVGENNDYRVAVLKVDWGPDLEPMGAPLGDSDELKLGQPIGIVGKSLNSVDTFASAGIISAIRKEMPDAEEPTERFLQFDASYQLSFLGGPLVDVYGNVVGMVRGTMGGVNLNLGVPINELVIAVDKIIAGTDVNVIFGVERMKMTMALQEQGYAPGSFDIDGDGEEDPVEWGMWVSYVSPNSPADVAGLQVGDTIVYLDDQFIDTNYAWESYVRDFVGGQLVFVKFIRKNAVSGEWEMLQTQVQVVEEPEDGEEGTGSSSGASGMTLPPGHP